MMHRTYLFLFLFLSANAFCQDTGSKREFREITMTGSGYERGLQHGKLLKDEIAEIVTLWKENTASSMDGDPEAILDAFFEYAGFTDAILEWTPDLYEEVKGIADGSGQSFRDVFVLNLLDEFWVYTSDVYQHHCSGLGVPGLNGSPSFVAQNMDIESYTDGYQVLMRITGSGDAPEQLVVTHPGLIALNGMNAEGIGVCVNTLMQLKASNSGLPVAFIVRRLTGSSDKEDILSFIQEVPHASGQNYLIGIRGEIFDYEASAGKVVRFDPGNTAGTIAHTNHPLANDDLKERYEVHDTASLIAVTAMNANSTARYEAVDSRITGHSPVTADIITDALRSRDDMDNPVCRTWRGPASGFTFASVIMELTGETCMRATAGPPDESEYVVFHFSR